MTKRMTKVSEHAFEFDIENLADIIAGLLREIQPNLNFKDDPELKNTPVRVAKAYAELLRGYKPLPFTMTTFPTTYKGMVGRKEIPITSMCAHHLLPYTGTCDFGIIYRHKKLGISKIIRAIQHWAARLTSQEELTDDIVQNFQKLMNPRGIIVIIRACHSCEGIRGVKVPNIPTITSSMTGAFSGDATRAEFFKLIEGG